MGVMFYLYSNVITFCLQLLKLVAWNENKKVTFNKTDFLSLSLSLSLCLSLSVFVCVCVTISQYGEGTWLNGFHLVREERISN